MNKKIDARGLACPKPVILTKKEIENIKEGTITTIVDNEISRDNLSKFAKSLELEFKVEEDMDGNFEVSIIKGGGDFSPSPKKVKPLEKSEEGPLIVIPSDLMGTGDFQLGKVLMKSFIYTVSETKPYPKAILFYNNGVKLTVKTSPVLEDLILLDKAGVEIISCGTCLDFYNLKDELGVGEISNMYTIYEKMKESHNTITIG